MMGFWDGSGISWTKYRANMHTHKYIADRLDRNVYSGPIFGLKPVCFIHQATHTHTRLTALFPGLPR